MNSVFQTEDRLWKKMLHRTIWEDTRQATGKTNPRGSCLTGTSAGLMWQAHIDSIPVAIAVVIGT